MAHDSTQRSVNAATTLRSLFETAAIATPDGLDFDALTDPGDAMAELIGHITSGYSWPASDYHEQFACDLAERLGTRATLDAVVAATISGASESIGNVARFLLNNGYAGAWETIVEQLPVELDRRSAAVILASAHCPVSGLLRVAQRCGHRVDWIIEQLDKYSMTAVDETTLTAVLAVPGDVDVILASKVRKSGWVGAETATKLLDGSLRQAALAVVGGVALFGDSHYRQLLDRLDDIGFAAIVAATVGNRNTRRTAAGRALIGVVAERAFQEPWLARLLDRASVEEVINAGNDRHWREGNAEAIATILVRTNSVPWYLTRDFHRADVCLMLNRSSQLSAAEYIDAVINSTTPVQRDVVETLAGFAPCFIEHLATRADGTDKRTAELAGIVNTIIVDNSADLPGAAARLWRALIDQRKNSPAADSTMTLDDVCATYMKRWREEAARKKLR